MNPLTWILLPPQGMVLPLRTAMGNGGKGRNLSTKELASNLSLKKGEISNPDRYF